MRSAPPELRHRRKTVAPLYTQFPRNVRLCLERYQDTQMKACDSTLQTYRRTEKRQFTVGCYRQL